MAEWSLNAKTLQFITSVHEFIWLVMMLLPTRVWCIFWFIISENSKDFKKVDFIAYSQLEGKHDADIEYFDLSQSCWQTHWIFNITMIVLTLAVMVVVMIMLLLMMKMVWMMRIILIMMMMTMLMIMIMMVIMLIMMMVMISLFPICCRASVRNWRLAAQFFLTSATFGRIFARFCIHRKNWLNFDNNQQLWSTFLLGLFQFGLI